MFRTVALALAACLFAGCGRSGFQIAALDGLLGGESDDLPGGDGTGGDGAGGDGADGGDGDGDGDNEVDPGPALFAAAYAGNELWMSYVANDGGDYFSATNQPCTAPTTYRSCVHAGEVRKLTLLSVPSCAGLSASDTLNAFDWVCADTSGGATFYSKLKRGRGLRDLIAPSGTSFASNSVTVSGFGVIPESSGVWFANPIVPLPPNAGTGVETLTASGTIYVETTSRDTLGYHVAADRIGIVTLG
ncbi:MAG TPA: hypothetical protein VLC93_04625, partial [Myxococcota bacterium]|nr:hypothetical protein [Myxococcota bacterium]